TSFGLTHIIQGWRSVAIIVVFALGFHALVWLAGSLYVAMAVHVAYDITAGLSFGRLGRELAPAGLDASPIGRGPGSSGGGAGRPSPTGAGLASAGDADSSRVPAPRAGWRGGPPRRWSGRGRPDPIREGRLAAIEVRADVVRSQGLDLPFRHGGSPEHLF